MQKRQNQKKQTKRVTLLTSILVLGVVFLVTFFIGSTQKNKLAETPTVSAKSLETVPFSSETMDDFSDSHLDKSIVEQKKKAKEKARQKALQKKREKEERKKNQTQMKSKGHVVYLTFDDGPSDAANKLLDTLDDYDAKATFFMLGPNMKAHPDVVKRMNHENFALGLHGISHDKNQVYKNASAPLNEMTQDRQIVKDITGVKTNLVRLPYGSIPYLTEEMRAGLDKHDFNIWDWNVDSRDWELKDQRFVQKTIQGIQQIEAKGEAPVILMHDKPETIQYLPQILDYLKKQGYQTKKLKNDLAPLTFQCEGRCHPI